MLAAVDSFSRKQLRLLNHGNEPGFMLLAGGSIRSGKTWAAALAFVMWSVAKFPGQRFILAGQSVEAVRRNYADDMLVMFKDLGFNARLLLTGGTRIVVPIGNLVSTYHIIGATDEKASIRLQGMTAAGALLDEVVTLPKSFWNQVLARLTMAGSKLWATFNPSAPGHWFKRDVVDQAERHDATVMQFGLDDNPVLSDEAKKRYRRSFSGHFHKRYIEGLWAAPSGLIFPDHEVVDDDGPFLTMAASVDWGMASVFAGLLFGRPRNGSTVCVNELIHDARHSVTLTEDQIVRLVVEWLGGVRLAVLYVDPTAPVTFKRKLRRAGLPVRDAANDVEAGLMVTANRLAQRSIVIHARCRHLLEEMGSYIWDERKAEFGQDVPVKQADHACDALRYYAYSTGKLAYAIGGAAKPRGM